MELPNKALKNPIIPAPEVCDYYVHILNNRTWCACSFSR